MIWVLSIGLLACFIWNLNLQGRISKTNNAVRLLGDGYTAMAKGYGELIDWSNTVADTSKVVDDVFQQQNQINQNMQDQITGLLDIIRKQNDQLRYGSVLDNDPTSH